jgi:hypothetical protein
MTPLNRREFLSSSALAGVALAFGPLPAANAAVSSAVRLEGRMTPFPATRYRAYVSKTARTPNASSWVQIDLGAATVVEAVRLYPNFQSDVRSLGFPVRMKIEGSTARPHPG